MIIRIILWGLAIILMIGSVIFLLRALRARSASQVEAYNVVRLNYKRTMMSQALAAIGALVGALILFAVGGFMSISEGEEEPISVAIPTLTPAAAAAEPEAENGVEVSDDPAETAVPTQTAAPTAAVSTSEPLPPTPEPTATVPPTPERIPAVVNSPVVGLYLRTAPGGEIIERLDDQVEVRLLGDEQTVDGLVWVTIVAASGNEGWVAQDYLLIGQTAEAVEATVEASETPTPDGSDG